MRELRPDLTQCSTQALRTDHGYPFSGDGDGPEGGGVSGLPSASKVTCHCAAHQLPQISHVQVQTVLKSIILHCQSFHTRQSQSRLFSFIV